MKSLKVVKTKETDWTVGMRWKGRNINQCMGNTEFLRCGSFYFAVAVHHSQLHVAENPGSGYGSWPVSAKNREKWLFYDVAHMLGLLGAVLVIQSDSSRKEGPVIPLLMSQEASFCKCLCWIIWEVFPIIPKIVQNILIEALKTSKAWTLTYTNITV